MNAADGAARALRLWRRTKNAMMPARIAAPPTPPITPPTIGPTLLFLEELAGAVVGSPLVAVLDDPEAVAEVAEGSADDSGAP